MGDEDPNAQGNSRRHIIEQCEASLRRLQTDYIDLYQIHRPQPDIPIDETLRALDDLVRAGKVRYIGTSTFAAWQLVESLWVSKELGLNRFVCEQPPYNLLDRRIERELLPMAQTYGLAIIPWSPLAGGLLTRQVPARRARRRTRASRSQTTRLYRRAHQRSASSTSRWRSQPIAAEKGCTLSQLALAWVHAAARRHQPDHRPAHDGAVRGQPEALDVRSRTTTASGSTGSPGAGTVRRAVLRGGFRPASVSGARPS